FYAFHDTWTPVRVALSAIVANILLSLVLMRTPLNYAGLALANSVAAVAESLALLWLLSDRLRRLDGHGLGLDDIAGRLIRTVTAAFGMALAVMLVRRLFEADLGLESSLALPLELTFGVAVGGAVYLALAFCLRLEEVRTLLDLIRRR